MSYQRNNLIYILHKYLKDIICIIHENYVI